MGKSSLVWMNGLYTMESSQVELACRAQSRLPTTLIEYLMILLEYINLSYLPYNRANQTFRAKLLCAPPGLTLDYTTGNNKISAQYGNR